MKRFTLSIPAALHEHKLGIPQKINYTFSSHGNAVASLW